ncbi:hypothetical protein V2J09_022998 [Rumex salicifolius]
MAQVELQKGKAQAPYVPRVSVVVGPVCIRVKSLRAHVGARAHEIRRFDVAVDDFLGVEVVEAVEDLARHAGELGFGEPAVSPELGVEGAGVHVLHEDGEVVGVSGEIEDLVAADDVGGVRSPEDVTLPEGAAADCRVGAAVDHLERVDGAGGAVLNLVDGAAVAVSEHAEFLVLGQGGGGGGGGRRVGGPRWR